MVEVPDEANKRQGRAAYSAAETNRQNAALTPVAYFAYMIPFHSPSMEQKDFLSFGELNRKETIYVSLKLKTVLLTQGVRRTYKRPVGSDRRRAGQAHFM